jgi:hypothetical protein
MGLGIGEGGSKRQKNKYFLKKKKDFFIKKYLLNKTNKFFIC